MLIHGSFYSLENITEGLFLSLMVAARTIVLRAFLAVI